MSPPPPPPVGAPFNNQWLLNGAFAAVRYSRPVGAWAHWPRRARQESPPPAYRSTPEKRNAPDPPGGGRGLPLGGSWGGIKIKATSPQAPGKAGTVVHPPSRWRCEARAEGAGHRRWRPPQDRHPTDRR